MAITITSKGYAKGLGDSFAPKAVNYGSPVAIILYASIIVFSSILVLWFSLLAVDVKIKNDTDTLALERTKKETQKQAAKQKERTFTDIQKRMVQIEDIINIHPNGKLLFDALSQITRGDVRFLQADINFKATDSTGQISMTGQAIDFQALSNQILSFERDKQNRFRSVKIGSIKREVSLDGSPGPVSFNLETTFERSILIPPEGGSQ